MNEKGSGGVAREIDAAVKRWWRGVGRVLSMRTGL